MTALAQLQREFQAYLLAEANDALAHVVDAGALSARERLDVYATAYRLRLIEALETDFIALRAHLGSEEFNAFATAYIAARPSTHYSLRYFGAGVASFLAQTFPYARTPLLAELAAFDWALTSAFDAPDDPVLTVAAMSAVEAGDWPHLRFRPHAALLRLDLAWNAPAIWKAADRGDALPAPQRAEQPLPWAVWRQNLDTFFRSLAIDEAYALDATMRGETFAHVCEGLCEWVDPEHAAARAAGFLRQWIEDGMIAEFFFR